MNRRLTEDALRATLRAGDPAQGVPPLDATERAAMRIAFDAATPLPQATARPLRWAAAGALLVVAAMATWVLREPAPPPPETVEEAAPLTTRQLDFKTPGGTRLIWVFDTPGPKEKS
ncbi:MAG: hypothetical protein SF066_08955 [Thermoanaerobaculia bacterium]|nr:hypothetical protein [Thermoanaerobaculia bacterium]